MIPVLYFHSVAPVKNNLWSRYYLTLELKFFEVYLKYFKNNGFRTIDLNEYSEIISNEEHLNEKVFCLTFDDGYADNFIYVYPLLKKFGFKGTIFVNPESVDKKNKIRFNLEDYWNGKVALKEIDKWGFLTWDEMRIMEKSGVIDIQSHTLTHTKYYISDKLTGFHYPGADCLYPVGNLYTDRIPYYINDDRFERLIPYGYPFFEEASSVIARRVGINDDFINAIVDELSEIIKLKKQYLFKELYKIIENVYIEFKNNNNIVTHIETEDDYQKRVFHELKSSKEIIESELNKKIDFCSWPHGDNSEFTHKLALKAGYKMTCKGKAIFEDDKKRIERISISPSKNIKFLTKIKVNHKIKCYMTKNPHYFINKYYQKFRYGKVI